LQDIYNKYNKKEPKKTGPAVPAGWMERKITGNNMEDVAWQKFIEFLKKDPKFAKVLREGTKPGATQSEQNRRKFALSNIKEKSFYE